MSQVMSLLDANQVTRAAYDDNAGSFSRGNWAVNNVPLTATQATVTKAAVSGTRHVCNSITVTIATGSTAQTPIMAYLRDGASGTGTILWSASLACPANSVAAISVPGLNILGTAGNAMTLEFAGAGVTASQQSVALCGWDAT